MCQKLKYCISLIKISLFYESLIIKEFDWLWHWTPNKTEILQQIYIHTHLLHSHLKE